MKIEGKPMYLGIELGPGAGRVGWEAPTRQFRERAYLWAGKGMGISYSIRAYGVLCVSILQFYLQFYGCNQEQRGLSAALCLASARGRGTGSSLRTPGHCVRS